MSFDNFEDIVDNLELENIEGGPSFFVLGYFNPYEDIKAALCTEDVNELIEVLYDQIAILEEFVADSEEIDEE